jgi:SAM-dependent methyltransferase
MIEPDSKTAGGAGVAMDLDRWIDLDHGHALLDVGCNSGQLLSWVRERKTALRLAGVEVNRVAVEHAHAHIPEAEVHACGAESLPFGDGEFDWVTCIEVLEHVPPELRSQVIREIHRVLKPGGALVLQVPHAGAFAWLDPNNLRYRMPRLYQKFIRSGGRDRGMRDRAEGVIWHHHFSLEEIENLTADAFHMERVRHGGLLLLPLADIACWPFYRIGKYDGAVFRFLQGTAHWDLNRDYGTLSYDVRCLLRRR